MKEINHSVERNKKILPEGTNFLWALQTWAPLPPSLLNWTATACVFFVSFLPQGTSSFVFWGCVTMGRTSQGRVTSNRILKLSLWAMLSPLTLLPLAGFWSIIHQVQANELDNETPLGFLFVGLIDWLLACLLFVFCLLDSLCDCGFLSFFHLLLSQTISLRLYITQFTCF